MGIASAVLKTGRDGMGMFVLMQAALEKLQTLQYMEVLIGQRKAGLTLYGKAWKMTTIYPMDRLLCWTGEDVQ